VSHFMTALAMKQKGLKPATKIVLYWIADHHNGETGKCFPSINRLASLCEMSRRAVENHISILEQAGLLRRHQQYREGGGKTTNSYILILPETSMDESDTQNLRMVSAKSAHGDTQNLRMNNLVSNNLGNITNNTSSNDDELDYYFEELWVWYPRKVGKGQAKKALKAALKKVSFDEIYHPLVAYVETLDDKDKQFIPHLATWLNGERWADEG
jgi:DNA-binding transcriptional ArsR family regulator